MSVSPQERKPVLVVGAIHWAGRCLERENMSDGVRSAMFASIAESHVFQAWECVNSFLLEAYLGLGSE